MCVCVCVCVHLVETRKTTRLFFHWDISQMKGDKNRKRKSKNFVFKTFSSPLLREYEQRREKNTLKGGFSFVESSPSCTRKKKMLRDTFLKNFALVFKMSCFFCVFFSSIISFPYKHA